MPNNIELLKAYAPALAGVYNAHAVTSVLDSGNELIRAGANAKEILIPEVTMSGLADYSRNDGYVKGAINQTWKTVAYDYDRGRKFSLDAMDVEESGLSVGSGGQILMTSETQASYLSLMTDFTTNQVSPEADAYRFAQYAGAAVTAGNTSSATYTDGNVLNKALSAIMADMSDQRVPAANRYLFIRPQLNALSKEVDLTSNKAIRDDFAAIIEAPSAQFMSAITLLTGDGDEAAGGYEAAEGAKNINFMIVHKPAVLQHLKHGVNKVIDPVANQNDDGWLMFYRLYMMAKAHPLRTAGLYASLAQ